MTVSLVGRIAIGRSSSLCPDLVTQATCNAKTQYDPLPRREPKRMRRYGLAGATACDTFLCVPEAWGLRPPHTLRTGQLQTCRWQMPWRRGTSQSV